MIHGLALALGAQRRVGAPPTAAPVNSVAPSISGIQTKGQTLTASTGTWSQSPTSYTYQWKRGGVNIASATASTYVQVTADVGTAITVAVVASNVAFGAGSAATSSATGTIADTLSISLSPDTTADTGEAYSSGVPTIAGGHAPRVVTSTAMPSGYSLNSSTGEVTAATVGAAGTVNIPTLTVTDADGLTATKAGWAITVTADETPSAFAFTDLTDAAVSATYTSNTITVAGLGTGVSTPVSITGGTYSKNGALYVSTATTAVNGDTFAVRQTASASNSTATDAVLTIGGVSDTYTVTTEAVEGAAPATWSPTDNQNVTLSNGDRTATNAASDCRGRSTNHILDADFYFEVTPGVIASGNEHLGVGLATELWDYATKYLGESFRSVGAYNNGGTYFHAAQQSLGGWKFITAGVTVGVRGSWHPGGTKEVSFTVDGVSWSTAVDLSTMDGDELYVAYDLGFATDAATLNTGASAFAYAGDTGIYSAFDAVSVDAEGGGGGGGGGDTTSGSPYTATDATLAAIAAICVPGDVINVTGFIDLCRLNGMEWDAPGITVQDDGDGLARWSSASDGYRWKTCKGVTVKGGAIDYFYDPAPGAGRSMIIYGGDDCERLVFDTVDFSALDGGAGVGAIKDGPEGARCLGGVLHRNCHVHDLYVGINVAGVNVEFEDCIFENMWNDAIKGPMTGGFRAERCTFRHFIGWSLHMDAIQIYTVEGQTDPVDSVIIKDCVFERGVGGTAFQANFLINEGGVQPAGFINLAITGNSYRGTAMHAITLGSGDELHDFAPSCANALIRGNFVQGYLEPSLKKIAEADDQEVVDDVAEIGDTLYIVCDEPWIRVQYATDNVSVEDNTGTAIELYTEIDGGGNVTIDPVDDGTDTTDYDAWLVTHPRLAPV